MPRLPSQLVYRIFSTHLLKRSEKITKSAILFHMWGEEEASLQVPVAEMVAVVSSSLQSSICKAVQQCFATVISPVLFSSRSTTLFYLILLFQFRHHSLSLQLLESLLLLTRAVTAFEESSVRILDAPLAGQQCASLSLRPFPSLLSSFSLPSIPYIPYSRSNSAQSPSRYGSCRRRPIPHTAGTNSRPSRDGSIARMRGPSRRRRRLLRKLRERE